MIITCPNCNKQFKIDNSLIPDEGRDLQCGSCDNIWFYKIKEENDKILQLKEEIIGNQTDIKNINIDQKTTVKKQTLEKNRSIKNNNKKKENSEKKMVTESKNIENKGSKFFSYLIVFIISIIALIVLLDTLKTPIINVFPELEMLLFNLFETLQDIKLFIIDLI